MRNVFSFGLLACAVSAMLQSTKKFSFLSNEPDESSEMYEAVVPQENINRENEIHDLMDKAIQTDVHAPVAHTQSHHEESQIPHVETGAQQIHHFESGAQQIHHFESGAGESSPEEALLNSSASVNNDVGELHEKMNKLHDVLGRAQAAEVADSTNEDALAKSKLELEKLNAEFEDEEAKNEAEEKGLKLQDVLGRAKAAEAPDESVSNAIDANKQLLEELKKQQQESEDQIEENKLKKKQEEEEIEKMEHEAKVARDEKLKEEGEKLKSECEEAKETEELNELVQQEKERKDELISEEKKKKLDELCMVAQEPSNKAHYYAEEAANLADQSAKSV
eukprot:GHVP01019738.1.p3 GENE.GHVP01019738.1~~GHVP01019738.1.p3  ORF type:complete len:336 (+),score=112.23 GHVP01019738.1:1902-2909(+)